MLDDVIMMKVMLSCNVGWCVVDADMDEEEDIDDHQPFPSLLQVSSHTREPELDTKPKLQV